MKTYKQLISELSLTSLVRYRNAASKQMKGLTSRDWEDYVTDNRLHRSAKQASEYGLDSNYMFGNAAEGQHVARTKGIHRATAKINRKMRVSRLAKPLEK